VIRVSTELAEAELYPYGAHLATWTPRGQRPVLYLSPRSLFTPGKAIRGGVPIIFPWFGPRTDGQPGPAHGFARTSLWSKESERSLDDGSVAIVMLLAADEFHLRFRATIGSELKMELETSNLGQEPRRFEEALHTYLAVGDVRLASASGLGGTEYVDKADGFRRKTLDDQPIRFGKETDQMHLNTSATCVVDDPAWGRRIVVEKSGSASTVVWNPWIEKTLAMSDMAPDGWKDMVCVETANAAENAVTLAPGETHSMTATIRVESL